MSFDLDGFLPYRLSVAASRISRRFAALYGAEAGLLCKSGHDTDRRLVTLELTAEGRALMRRLGRIATAFQAELIAELGPEAGALDRALTRLIGDTDA